MDRQIIEIMNEGFHLSLSHGFLVLENNAEQTQTRISLDNILSLIISAHQLSLSKNIINALSEQGICIFFCGKNYLPTTICMPYTGHWLIAPRVHQQLDCSIPLRKKLWQSIVQNKIKHQAQILNYFFPGHPHLARLNKLSQDTLSGDTQNNEGIAANIYFKSLLGPTFVRDRNQGNINAILNYTYTILRSMVARSIAGNGLLPQLGLKHCNQSNPLPLVDDLIEPFRAFADKIAYETVHPLQIQEEIDLTPTIKRNLSSITTLPVMTGKGKLPLYEGINDFVNSVVHSFESKKVLLRYPTLIDINR